MISNLAVIVCLVPFYLLGCFPTGLLVASSRGVDITKQGSGNVGATNIGRVLGKGAGVITLAGDAAKGLIAVALAWLLWSPERAPAAGLAAVLGHCFPVPISVGNIRLKGGKGVATALGVLIFLHPAATLLGVGVFAGVIGIFKIVSLASVSAALCIPIFAMLFDAPGVTIFCMSVISLIVVFRHRENLERLARGTEKKISFGRS